MRIEGSKQLVEGDDGLYVIIGTAGGGYELYRARLDHVSSHRRKWQAVAAIKGDD
jgi:hypothetical protein